MTLFRSLTFLLLLIATVALVAIAYLLYVQYVLPEDIEDEVLTTEQYSDSANASATTSETSVASDIPATGLVIDIRTLPETQQGVLKSLGYEQTITFTPEMISCAEERLGRARVIEIKNGATPTILESASLMACI